MRIFPLIFLTFARFYPLDALYPQTPPGGAVLPLSIRVTLNVTSPSSSLVYLYVI